MRAETRKAVVGRAEIEDVTSYKKLQEGERFIGLGEKTGNLDRRGFAYTNWNSDTFAYRTDADPDPIRPRPSRRTACSST